MDQVFNQIVEKGGAPTRDDIAALLASVGKPGKKRDEKKQAVERLFSEVGGGVNPQGFHVVEDLESYEAY